jgi:hypothetical protein
MSELTYKCTKNEEGLKVMLWKREHGDPNVTKDKVFGKEI